MPEETRVMWSWEFLQNLPTTEDCYKLSERDIAFLLNVNPAYEWETRWYDTLATEQAERSQFGHDVMKKLMIPSEECADGGETELGSCYRMDTTTEAFKYYPNDPFSGDEVEIDAIQSGTKFARWKSTDANARSAFGYFEELISGIVGYRDNDVFVIPDFKFFTRNLVKAVSDFFAFFSKFQLPYVLIEFEGDGQLEVELLNVPFGGNAVLVPDFELSLDALLSFVVDVLDGGALPATWRLVELNREVLGAPPELVSTVVQEFEYEGAGEHTMHVVFVPAFQLTPPFWLPFGGIREIEACGNIQIKGQQTGTLYDEIRNADDSLRTRKGAIAAMTAQDICEGMKCWSKWLSQTVLLGMDDNLRGGVDVVEQDDGTFVTQLSSQLRQAIDAAPDVIPEANIYGSAIAAENGLQAAHDIITTGQANGVAQADVVSILTFSFEVDAAEAATAVASIYADIVATDPVFDDFSGYANLAYCEGVTVFTLSNFIFANAAAAELATAIDFMSMFEPEQFAIWRDVGLTKPKEGYQTTDCYQIPDQFFTITKDLTRSDTGTPIFDGSAGTYPIYNLFPDTPVRTSEWSYLLYATGSLQHTNGDVLQLWHKRVTLIWSTNDVRLTDGGVLESPENLPLRSQNPYYAEYHMTVGTEARGIRWTIPNWHRDDMSGQIVLTLVDNGKVT